VDLIARNDKAKGIKQTPSILFHFKVEERVQFKRTLQVKYKSRIDNALSLSVPSEKQRSNFAPGSTIPRVSLKECLISHLKEEFINFYSADLKQRTNASKTTKLVTFPPYLIIQIKRFVFDLNLEIKKLDILVDVPDELDIEWMKSKGPQPNEIIVPDEQPDQSQAHDDRPFAINEDLVTQLSTLGFSRGIVLQALRATSNDKARATDWLYSHQNCTELLDGAPRYKLFAFISHMGKSPHSGHYVCHILKENKWVLYNDEKVALTQYPPKDMGYLYVFQRLTL